MKLAESRSRRNSTQDCLSYIIDDLDELKEEASVFGFGEQVEGIIKRLEVANTELIRDRGGFTWENR